MKKGGEAKIKNKKKRKKKQDAKKVIIDVKVIIVQDCFFFICHFRFQYNSFYNSLAWWPIIYGLNFKCFGDLMKFTFNVFLK